MEVPENDRAGVGAVFCIWRKRCCCAYKEGVNGMFWLLLNDLKNNENVGNVT